MKVATPHAKTLLHDYIPELLASNPEDQQHILRVLELLREQERENEHKKHHQKLQENEHKPNLIRNEVIKVREEEDPLTPMAEEAAREAESAAAFAEALFFFQNI